MQAHPDFIFHLDEPLEEPTTGNVPLRGWIAAQVPIGEVRLRGKTIPALRFEERPDVGVAFPAFQFVAGFIGEVSPGDLCDGALHFSFGAERLVTQPLAPPPEPPPFVARMWSRLLRLFGLARLRLSRDPRTRWTRALHALLLAIRIERGGDFRRAEIDRVLALFAECLPDAVVVQIGANDGVTGDPLAHLFAKTRWTGLLVEPVPYLCERVARRYRDRPDVHVEQVAISDREGDAPLYRVQTEPGATPQWFDQLASLDREVLLKHRASIHDIEARIIEERIKTVRLATLLEQHHFERVDLLVLDTEGHDHQILRDFDFNRFQPLLIVFEHQHLSAADKLLAYKLVRANGYDYAETAEGDAVAWRLRRAARL